MTGQRRPRSGGEAAELSLGIEEGFDPSTALGSDFADDADGIVITRSWSWWSGTACRTCGHTFRRGDRVLVANSRHTVQHLVPGVRCGTDPEPGADTGTSERDELAGGLLATWPVSAPVTRLAPDDWRIPRSVSPAGFRPPVCLYCGHTFRAGEYVVICPCTPYRPACGAAVHRDPAAGLPCWDRWHPEGELLVCPITLGKL